jgi:hypothetical protein
MMRLPRRALLAAFFAAPAMARADVPAPAAPISALLDALAAGMRAGKSTPFARRAAALRPAVERAFDLPAILRASVGPRWASIPAMGRAEASRPKVSALPRMRKVRAWRRMTAGRMTPVSLENAPRQETVARATSGSHSPDSAALR